MSISKTYACDLCGFKIASGPDSVLHALRFNNSGFEWEPRPATDSGSSERHICRHCIVFIRSARPGVRWVGRSARSEAAPIDFSPWPTETLETALRFQLEREPAAFIADCRQGCGGRARCGGVCADCLRAELKLREVAAKTEGSKQ